MGRVLACVLVLAGCLQGQVLGQRGDETGSAFLRSNPSFKAAFRHVVQPVAASTVRVLCDNEDAALGIIVGPSGWVLTKATSIQGKITCKLKDGRVVEGRLLATNHKHDLALLKIEASGLTPVSFADSTSTLPGSWVACAGLDNVPVGFGVVSVATRNVPRDGGPIESPDAGYLGIAMDKDPAGVKIIRVLPDSGAEKAGIKKDDIVTLFAGKKVSDLEDFKAILNAYRPGQVVPLKVQRGDEELELKAKLGKKPSNRGESQNNMGSKLSKRRSGYPTILQFDGLVMPGDCGGPLVNLEGKVIGICISRAGRTENWAVPSEVIRPILLDLMVQNLRQTPLEVKSDSAKEGS